VREPEQTTMPRKDDPYSNSHPGRRGGRALAQEVDEDEILDEEAPEYRRSAVLGLVYWTMVLGVWAILAVGAFLAYHWAQLPQTDAFFQKNKAYSVTVYDVNGRLIARRGVDAGLPVSLDQLPSYVANAVIATEDRRFYDHFGLDVVGLLRAIWVNLEAGRVKQGGSTITQQLAKNLFLTGDRTMSRKIQEAMLAFYLENHYSKDEIITLYLNTVYFGAGAYGVDAAARRYFGKGAPELNLKEAAILAGLLKAPSRFSPKNDQELSLDRAAIVLQEMEEAGFITAEQRASAANVEPLMAQMQGAGGANYFIDYVMERLPKFIGEPRMDVRIRTSLDLNWQKAADTAIASALAQDGTKLGVTQGALVSLGPDGAIRAMVGGKNYGESVYNRAVQARRQPGSSFKPFAYLAALEGGMTPDDIVKDEPFTKNGWSPQNFEKGPPRSLTLEQALSLSVNTVAARLTDRFGAKSVRKVAHRLGIQSELDAIPSIALGTEEVTLLELTGAYIPFANGGRGAMPYAIVEVQGVDGTVFYKREGSGLGEIVKPEHAAQMNRMLTAAVEHGTGRRAKLDNRPAGGKTGTTQDFKDAWFIGFSGDIVTGVWTGNDKPTPMKKVTGGSFPTLIWKSFMTAALENRPVRMQMPVEPETPSASVSADVAAVRPDPAAEPEPAAEPSVAVAPVSAKPEILPADSTEAPDETDTPQTLPDLPPDIPEQKDARLRKDPLAQIIQANARQSAVTPP
jgi:penicillin-binding protein 1A